MKSRPQFLLQLFLDILGTAKTPGFRSATERFTLEYKRSSNEDQGAYHWLLAEDHRKWVKINSCIKDDSVL